MGFDEGQFDWICYVAHHEAHRFSCDRCLAGPIAKTAKTANQMPPPQSASEPCAAWPGGPLPVSTAFNWSFLTNRNFFIKLPGG
jgi:hypothetical protein